MKAYPASSSSTGLHGQVLFCILRMKENRTAQLSGYLLGGEGLSGGKLTIAELISKEQPAGMPTDSDMLCWFSFCSLPSLLEELLAYVM